MNPRFERALGAAESEKSVFRNQPTAGFVQPLRYAVVEAALTTLQKWAVVRKEAVW